MSVDFCQEGNTVKSFLHSPLDGRVNSRLGRRGQLSFWDRSTGKVKKIALGLIIFVTAPLLVTSLAASVTIGSGNIEFGQGSQQAVACDSTVFLAFTQSWYPAGSYFKVDRITIAGIDTAACASKKFTVRVISSGATGATAYTGLPSSTSACQSVGTEEPIATNSANSSILANSLTLTLTASSSNGVLTAPVAKNSAGAVVVATGVTGALNIGFPSLFNGVTTTATNAASAQGADLNFELGGTAFYLNGACVARGTVETTS